MLSLSIVRKLLLFCLMGLLNTSPSIAQKSILQKVISVKITNQPLSDALRAIGEQGNFSFSYNPTEFDLKKRITVQANNLTIKQILDDIFKGQATYTERKSHIILHRVAESKEASLSKQTIITGYIYDYQTNKPLPNASVFEKQTLTSAVSNQAGYFKIQLSNANDLKYIEIRKKNYLYKTVKWAGKQPLEIALFPIEVQQPTITKIEPKQISKDTLVSPVSMPILIVSTDTTLPKAKRKMDLQELEETFVELFTSAKQAIHTENIQDTLYRDFQISLLPFVGTNHTMSGNVINTISLNIFAGYSLGVTGFEIGGFANLIRRDMLGAQAAGFANIVGRDAYGIQGAGFTNAVVRNGGGVQGAGFANFVAGDFEGIQGAGFLNIVGKNAKNTIQAAGFANIALGDLKGIQASGFVNIANKNVRGLQASGFFNYAHTHQKGVQVSVFNYADSSGGLPIGLLSFVKTNGYRRLEIGSNELNFAQVVFKSGVQKFYNFLAVGSNFGYANKPLFTAGYGIGTAQYWGRGWFTNADGGYYRLVDSYSNILSSKAYMFRVDLGVEKKFSKRFGIFVGPSLSIMNATTNYLNTDKSNLISLFPQATIRNGRQLSNWIGLQGGIRFSNKRS